jgi:hypothetical protein
MTSVEMTAIDATNVLPDWAARRTCLWQGASEEIPLKIARREPGLCTAVVIQDIDSVSVSLRLPRRGSDRQTLKPRATSSARVVLSCSTAENFSMAGRRRRARGTTKS